MRPLAFAKPVDDLVGGAILHEFGVDVGPVLRELPTLPDVDALRDDLLAARGAVGHVADLLGPPSQYVDADDTPRELPRLSVDTLPRANVAHAIPALLDAGVEHARQDLREVHLPGEQR
eukprot:3993907-Pyramimonas_sp.AAC.1